MRWADNRLLRRMIRDSWHRNLQPEQTLTHWHYVRRSELRNIIPFIGSVDYLVNSAMPFELPILKARLFKFFPPAMEKFKNDAKRQDAYVRANYWHKDETTTRGFNRQGGDIDVPSQNVISASTGIFVNDWQIKLYLNNVTNSRPLLQIFPNSVDQTLPSIASSVRPRTLGLELSYLFGN